MFHKKTVLLAQTAVKYSTNLFSHPSGAKGFSQELVTFISLEKSLLWSVLFSETPKKSFNLPRTLTHQVTIFGFFPAKFTSRF